MSNTITLSQQILDSMADGVLVVNSTGKITTLNPSGSSILGLRADEVEGHSLAEVFIGDDDRYADFVDTLIEAIYSGALLPERVVAIDVQDRVRSLKLTTSYLDRHQAGDGRVVLAVFTDVTDLEQARQAEQALSDELQGKHRELQDAYLEIESRNKDLQHAYQHSGRMRLIMTAAVVCVFAGVGYWAIPHASLPDFSPSQPTISDSNNSRTFDVAPRAIETLISFSGRFRPGDVLTLVSPFESTLLARHFDYGERVTEGDLLLELDSTAIDIRYRRARSELADAESELKSVENWAQGREMTNARRSLRQAERSLNNDRRELDDVEHLFERGIIPERELRSARERVAESLIRVEAAQQELEETKQQGGERAIARAVVEVKNARAEYEQIRNRREEAKMYAPVDGVVLSPLGEDRDNDERLEAGTPVSSGSALLAVGDLSSLEITGAVDELDIRDISVGQNARVTMTRGEGKPMQARVSYVSSQAQETNSRGLPSFRLIVRVDDLSPEQLKKIRIGMSASVDIITHKNPEALIVPHNYIGGDGGTEHWVLRQTASGTERVNVEPGRSRFDGVLIKKGLKPGDQLILPGSEI